MFVNVAMNAIRQYLTHQQALWLDTFQPLDYGALSQVPQGCRELLQALRGVHS